MSACCERCRAAQLWRAVSLRPTREGVACWHGRWQDKPGALRQAQRWLERADSAEAFVSIESTTGETHHLAALDDERAAA